MSNTSSKPSTPTSYSQIKIFEDKSSGGGTGTVCYREQVAEEDWVGFGEVESDVLVDSVIFTFIKIFWYFK